MDSLYRFCETQLPCLLSIPPGSRAQHPVCRWTSTDEGEQVALPSQCPLLVPPCLLQVARSSCSVLSDFPLPVCATVFNPFIWQMPGWCYILVIMNSAAVNNREQIHLQRNGFMRFGYAFCTGIPGSDDPILFLVFREISMLFSTMAALINIPTHSVAHSISSEHLSLSVFYVIITVTGGELIAQCNFDLHIFDSRGC